MARTWTHCPYHCPWMGAKRQDVERWVRELYGCDLETWERNRERWDREDAESTRRELYPTAAELVADDQ